MSLSNSSSLNIGFSLGNIVKNSIKTEDITEKKNKETSVNNNFKRPYQLENLDKYGNSTDRISSQVFATSNFHVPNIQQMQYNARSMFCNDYSNHFIHSKILPTNYIRNVENIVDGYPKLEKLLALKNMNNAKYFSKPYGCKAAPNQMANILNEWIVRHKLLFDTIMIGSLTENQFCTSLLASLPLEKLCSKPGFLYLWGSSNKMDEMTQLLTGEIPSSWSGKFRRSEEIVFTVNDVINDNDRPQRCASDIYHQNDVNPYSIAENDESLFIQMQWHCCMCITGTVRRSADGHLINCNINTDLKIQDENEMSPNAVPDSIYKIAENFSSGNRRLHIIPSRSGYNIPVKVRPGWIIMSPDVILNNFDAESYKDEIQKLGYNVAQHPDIESLRPKTPSTQ